MGIVMGTLVFGTRTLYAKRVYQGAVGRYWRNWPSLKLFLTVLGRTKHVYLTSRGRVYDFFGVTGAL